MLILANAFGFVVEKWRWFAVFAAIVLAFVLLGFIFRAFHKSPKLNQVEIVKSQTAIATQDREEMTKILVDSDVREKNIDANVAYANTEVVNAQAESKKQWSTASNDEMAAELERRAQENQ